ncbi:MAG: hypothetical protein AAGF48_06110 [Pseudomonadota bacterium]
MSKKQTVEQALAALRERQDQVVAKGSGAAALIDVNTNTLKARVAHDKIMAMREPAGQVRDNIRFTPRQLVLAKMYFVLADAGFEPKEVKGLDANFPERAILKTIEHPSWVCWVREINGSPVIANKIDGSPPSPGTYKDTDSVLVISIGRLVCHLALSLYERDNQCSAA